MGHLATVSRHPGVPRSCGWNRVCQWSGNCAGGLVPSRAKDARIGNSPVNARARTVAEKPSFGSAFKGRRCLVPADGFYECRHLRKLKQPRRSRRPGDRPFVFAGLWESWHVPAEPGAEPLESFTIITTEPNAVEAPVILDGEGIRRWLENGTAPGSLAALLRPCPDADLTRRPVAPLVGSPKNDLPQCIAPLPMQTKLDGL